MQTKCAGQKRDGAPCHGVPWGGTSFCWYHAPQAAAQRARGRTLGGAARSNQARARKELANAALGPDELQGILGVTIKAVLAGTKSPGIGSAIAGLVRAAVTVRDAVEVEQRLSALEDSLTIDLRKRA